MLLVEKETGSIIGVGNFKGEAPSGSYYVDGPYAKNDEVVTNISQIEEEIALRILEGIYTKRIATYKTESDPLYMEWQFDQTPESEQAWRDKVEEIKLRYPLVEA